MAGISPPSTGGRVQRATRVARACDYCRKKRLKCTSKRYPCLNCQLYNAECTTKDRVGRRSIIVRNNNQDATSAAVSGGVSATTPPEEPSIDVAVNSSADAFFALADNDEEDENDNDASNNNVNSNHSNGHGHHDDGSNNMDSNMDNSSITRAIDNNELNGHHPDNQNSLSSLPWAENQGFDVVNEASQDFGHVLRQLGIGVSSNFWDLDRTMLTNMANTDAHLMGGVDGSDRLEMGQMPPDAIPIPIMEGPSAAASFASPPKSIANSTNGRVSAIESLTTRDNEVFPSKQSLPPGVFIRKDQTLTNYIGLCSVGATLALCLKDALDSQRVPLDASSLSFLIEAGPHVDEVGLLSLCDLSSRKLPPRAEALQQINAYFRNLNTFYPILDEESFMARADMFYTAQRPLLRVLDYSLFYLVQSIGALCMQHDSDNPKAYEKYAAAAYEQAWSLIHESIGMPCETSLQILLLHVVRQIYFGKCGIAWVFCGIAIRIAQSLGLHRKIPEEIDLSDSQLHLRSRLWWILLNFDSNLSLSQGRPPGVEDTAHDGEVVVDGKSDVHSDPSYPTLSLVYIWTCQLGQVQNRFCNAMHSRNDGSSRIEALVQLDRELTAWMDSLPTSCRPGYPILSSSDIRLHILLIHLECFNLLRAIHWAVISLRPALTPGVDAEKLAARLQASDTLCVEAARSFIKSLNGYVGAI
ncbi:fungal-specific transcription factor domain-containing protein [Dactylonectria estremocensis]|uniref:Fungal-specific transcription factor domain-containing protein n=1 Tax=Dactylonectria estremocensis TaxID=1079267 RepID=A0A9P9DCQ1_9HYPO|nr:fungal-specific transcription factor domain-containing protein [Dactylonectria estremocensis]